MFWIGLIVGIIIGAIVCHFGMIMYAMKATGMSIDEMEDCGLLLIDAGQNRESAIVLYHDDDELDRVVLEERDV